MLQASDTFEEDSQDSAAAVNNRMEPLGSPAHIRVMAIRKLLPNVVNSKVVWSTDPAEKKLQKYIVAQGPLMRFNNPVVSRSTCAEDHSLASARVIIWDLTLFFHAYILQVRCPACHETRPGPLAQGCWTFWYLLRPGLQVQACKLRR